MLPPLIFSMSSAALSLRCKTKMGQYFVTGLYLGSSVGQLKSKISELTKIPKEYIRVKQGINVTSIQNSIYTCEQT
jgi:hypothetical protein